MLESLSDYMALMGPDQLYLLLDGLAKVEPYVPEPSAPEEQWRKILREKANGQY